MPKAKQPFRTPFLKLFSKEWLEGSVRFECDEAERGIFVDLLALANESRQRGIIQANPTTAYPLSWLAGRLNTNVEFLKSCLKKFTEQGRINEGADGIHIVNFNYYQEQLYPRRGRPPKYQSESAHSVPKPYQDSIDTESKKGAEDLLARMSSRYQEEIGIISSVIAAQLKDFAQHCQDKKLPAEWIDEAFAEAAAHNKRSWAYVKAILNEWIEHGRGKRGKGRGRELPTKYTEPPDYGDD